MDTTEFQLFVSRNNPAIWAMPSVALAGLSILRFDIFRNIWWVLVGFQILMIMLVYRRFVYNRGNNNISYIDAPRPASILYLLRLGVMPLLLIVSITIGSCFLLDMLWQWKLITPLGWLFGMLAFGIWVYAFRIVSTYSTMYLLNDKGLWIYYGVDKIYIPYSKISDIQISATAKMNWAQIIHAGHIYIPGVRNYDFILLRLKLTNPVVARWFPDIYLTPTNTQEFLNLVQRQMKTLPS